MSISHITHQTVLITGAGSGLGRATANHFAADGWQVGITDANLEAARQTLQAQAFPAGSFAAELDVTQADHWQRVQQQIQTEWSGIGVLINNAGVAAAGSMESGTLEDWEWLHAINVLAVAQGCRQFLPVMRTQNNGHIVNIASFAALAGAPEMSNYGASKAAVLAASESLYTELASTGIGVTAACPAFIRTDLLSTMRAPANDYRKRAQRWMDTSGFTAEDFASAVYAAINRKKFLLITHRQSRWLWRLKRLAPNLYYHLLRKSVRKFAQRKQ